MSPASPVILYDVRCNKTPPKLRFLFDPKNGKFLLDSSSTLKREKFLLDSKNRKIPPSPP